MKPIITEFGTYNGKHVNLFIIKNLFKLMIKKILKPFIFMYFVLKYKNIWNLKKYLKDNNIKSGLLFSYYLEYFNKLGAFVGVESEFEDIPCFPHGVLGVFISNEAKIGKNCVIFQQVTIGSNTVAGTKSCGSPTIGDNVYIGAGTKIIGNIKIGNNARIGANTVVNKDVLDNMVVADDKFIQKENLDNNYYVLSKRGKFVYKDGNYVKVGDNNEKK